MKVEEGIFSVDFCTVHSWVRFHEGSANEKPRNEGTKFISKLRKYVNFCFVCRSEAKYPLIGSSKDART